MALLNDMMMKPTIVYFSGTGNVAYVARQLEDAFLNAGISPTLLTLESKGGGAIDARIGTVENEGEGARTEGLAADGEADHPQLEGETASLAADRGAVPLSPPSDLSDSDFLVIVFPVHAFDAPAPIFDFVARLNAEQRCNTAVFSVSGGGDVISNRACRERLIRKLERKGFTVVYEAELTMMSNFLFPTPPPAATALLHILPEKCALVVDHLQAGIDCRIQPPLFDRMCSLIGPLERSRSGQGLFGRHIRAGSACTACAWCVKSCPRGNIIMHNGIPSFGEKCVICFRCLYGCPQNALRAEVGQFLLIKEGYSLKALLDYAKDQKPDEEKPLADELKGFLWAGVRNYLGLE